MKRAKCWCRTGIKNPVEVFFGRRECGVKNCPAVVKYKGIRN